MYEVIVGNIGRVHTGNNRREANKIYREYVKDSAQSTGRASGEQVTLFEDGEPVRAYDPPEVDDVSES